jgi:hypothetical protein
VSAEPSACREKCEDLGKHGEQSAVYLQQRRQPDNPCDDARRMRRGWTRRRRQAIAAKDLGGKPEDYEVANERVFRKAA